ncbi:MAG: nitrous oxide-stimulated promoter family protein [Desulfuromonadaceae bacterium]|nr:nitrous oxide-stimulated promoter family protein [Desulfuromonadaceae bacterium]MDD2855026.1 nitrous oxide-stimulated promoter family protein [Desulfuromonadaceae bacterium]
MEALNRQQKSDIRLIGKFVEVYCHGRHKEAEQLTVTLPEDLGQKRLCSECREFIEYAVARRIKCPLEAEKPSCKHCRIHCYDKPNREKVRRIMSYSGRRLMMRGRLDYLWHYFF